MRLVLHVEGASAVELARGVSAAQAVFDAAAADPWLCALGAYARETWDDQHGFDEEHTPSDDALDAAATMDAAESAAVDACCADWPEACIRTGRLEVRRTEAPLAEQLIDAAEYWVDHAAPERLWHVLRHGGLRAEFPVLDGLPQAAIRLADDGGPLAGFGILSAETPAGETLAFHARQWGATEPPAAEADQLSWFLNQEACALGAWEFLRDQIQKHRGRFEAVAANWRGPAAGP